MKVYLSGKISGDPDYKNKFAFYAETYEDQGHVVLNPADLPEGMEPSDYMRICLAMMEVADLVVFLPDWAASLGANLEWEWCKYTGKDTFFEEEPK